MAKAEYRSAVRSKKLIKKALAKLIHENDATKITVSDIIREADISRGTFYAHYSDVNAVIEQIESEELKNLVDFVEEFGFDNISDNITHFVNLICDYLCKDIEYYRMLAQSKVLESFLWRLFNIYYDKLFEQTVNCNPLLDKDEIRLYLLYTTSASKNVIISWLCGDISGTPKQLSERLGKLISLNGLYLKTKSFA